ncbi:alpha-1,6-mannosyltransferase [Psychroflexus sp. MBR-150]|jgi:hypothetical protein
MQFKLSNSTFIYKHNVLLYALLGCFAYGYISYFLVRSEFYQLVVLVALLFFISYILIAKSQLKFEQLFFLSIIYRLIFLFSIPNLSQDFFRFFWDGQLTLQGINPYVENVLYYFSTNRIEHINQADILRQGMGELNAGHFSNYPPLSQYIYAVCAWFAKSSILGFIISIRLVLISFDLLFIKYASKLLQRFKLDPRKLFWYILNPLCIIEITGNLHLEGVMISFFLIAFYYFLKHKTILSALFLSLSISTKLLSLVFLPILLKYYSKKFKPLKAIKKIVYFVFFTIVFLVMQFAFFYEDKFFNNFLETIGLWFGKFEFNASIFYLIRWIGYQLVGWNIIQTYGWIMPIVSVLIFVLIIYKQQSKPAKMLETFMWMLTVYFLLSTTVHPWYILFPLALSVFTKYSFVYLWSFLVFLSYFAYKTTEVTESMGLLTLQYAILVAYMLFEISSKRNANTPKLEA